ncbi:MAG: hypothetical protein ACM3RX_06615 [Methanococcaceae archaeon]|jgi:hypothetical protein
MKLSLKNLILLLFSPGEKHAFMRKGELVLMIPNPHKGTIRVDLLTRILKQARIQEKNGLGKNSNEKI